MLAWQPDSRPRTSRRNDVPLRRDVSHFLIESEQRVIAHCVAMLGRDVTADERRRLLQVLTQTETRLRRLAGVAA